MIRHLDIPLPDLLDVHQAHPARYPFLLESVTARAATTPETARYDILFAFPGEHLLLDAAGRCHGPHADGNGFLPALDAWWQATGADAEQDTTLPFRGGWFLYLGYELAAEIEPGVAFPAAGPGLPVAAAVRVPAAVVLDHQAQRVSLVAEASHADKLEVMEQDLRAATAGDAAMDMGPGTLVEDPPARYLQMVSRARRYIYDGDIFQANLSRAWHWRAAGRPPAPQALYRRLRRHNPAPFAALARLNDAWIISSSPERLARRRGRILDTRPIAGTRPRGGAAGQDRALSAELLAHPKEQAEHIMLIDLERNDLGRVCEPGSVEVDALMVLESYAHVHHIVSNVRGRLRKDVTPADIIRAVFPGGTITGCPKVRCMEIIAELEQAPRGAYTGSLGYLNRDGDLDLNILIRTLVQQGSEIRLRAGAGIVADSDPGRELEETRAKARGLLLALPEAGA